MPQEDMSKVDAREPGPTDPQEMDKLKSRYPYDSETGTFSFQIGDDE